MYRGRLAVIADSRPLETVGIIEEIDVLGGALVIRNYLSTSARVIIDQGVGRVPAAGSIEVRPSRTTRYTLTASGQPPYIEERRMQQYKVIGSGFSLKSTVRVDVPGFVGSRQDKQPDYRPAEAASDGTWLKVFIYIDRQATGKPIRITVQNSGSKRSVSQHSLTALIIALLDPVASINAPTLDCFRQMLSRNLSGSVQIGHSSRDMKTGMMRGGRDSHASDPISMVRLPASSEEHSFSNRGWRTGRVEESALVLMVVRRNRPGR